MKSNKIAPVILLLLVISSSAYAQFEYNRFANSDAAARKLEYLRKSRQRSTVGMSFRFASANFKAHYTDNANNTPSLYRAVDTTVEKSVSTELNYSAGVFYDWYSPVARLDEKSILALSV